MKVTGVGFRDPFGELASSNGSSHASCLSCRVPPNHAAAITSRSLVCGA